MAGSVPWLPGARVSFPVRGTLLGHAAAPRRLRTGHDEADHAPPVVGMVLPFEPLWMRARAGSLHPGDLTPDFTLPALDHKSSVQLSSFRGSRPVVLVFGSYT